MNRRRFGAAVGAAALAAAVPAAAQRRGPARIAWLSTSKADWQSPAVAAFRSGLAELGLAEGVQFFLDLRWGEESPERLANLVTEVLRSAPDLIVTQGPAVFPVQRSQTPVPIVFAFSGDPVEAGLVASLARPGGNLTGMSMMSLELVGKRMEALAEAIPRLRRVAMISNPAHAGEQAELRTSLSAAARLGIALEYLPIRGEAGLDGALAAALTARSQAIVAAPDAGMMRNSERFAAFASQHRVPAISGWSEFVRRGNVLSYGPNMRQVFRRLASYVDRILKGARPADLPVELPTAVELAVNLKAARTIGLALPQSLLLRADEVVE